MAVKYKVIMLRCACGNERETDIEVARASATPCATCGKTEWTLLRNIGKKIVEDKSAPTELIAAQERERGKAND
jgi:hypothetical protein